jgi:hypothetical protein
MLRVVLKLHHVHLAVRAQHQLALRPAPHPPDMLHRQNRQPVLPLRTESQSNSMPFGQEKQQAMSF